MSKYVNPTGDGYLGVATVSNRSVGYGVGMWPVDWDGNTEVYAVIEEPGVALFTSDVRPPEYITTYQVSIHRQGRIGPSLTVSGPVLDILGAVDGDDVRAYERDLGGVMLVPSNGDPYVEADDG